MPKTKQQKFTRYYGVLFGVLNLIVVWFFGGIYLFSLAIFTDIHSSSIAISISIVFGSYLAVWIVSKGYIEKGQDFSTSNLASKGFSIGILSIFTLGFSAYLALFILSYIENNERLTEWLLAFPSFFTLFFGVGALIIWFWLVFAGIITAIASREILGIPSRRPKVDPRDFE